MTMIEAKDWQRNINRFILYQETHTIHIIASQFKIADLRVEEEIKHTHRKNKAKSTSNWRST